ARSQTVRHLAEGALDALLVLGHPYVFLDLRVVKIRAQFAGMEDRQADLRHETPAAGASVEQPAHLAAGAPGSRSQGKIGKRGRGRGSYVGIGGVQAMLGGADIRASLQQF